MDRTAFAVYAVALGWLAIAGGCGDPPASPPHDAAPLVLAELKAASPGPWRHDAQRPVPTTALQRDSNASVPPAPLDRGDLFDLERRWNARPAALRASANPRDVETPAATPPQATKTPDPPAPPAASPPETHGAQRAGGAPRMLAEIASAERLAAGRLPAPSAQEPNERVLLPWAAAPPSAPARTGASQQAADHVAQGFRLAERNALYLARAEFLAALERIAEASDASQNTRFYGDAVAAGLTALEESGDFLRRRSAGRQPDIARIVSGHKTPILKRAPLDRLSPTAAAERYATYAQEQLAGAAAGHAAASTALFGLGKIAVALGSANPARRAESTLHAAALYRAALMVDARNFRAANELGVILARKGDWLRARELLVQSASLGPNPVTHRNLAAIYARLGETQLAAAAKARAAAMEQSGQHVQAAVQWVDPATFASTAPASDSLLPPAGARPSPVPGETPAAAHEAAESTARRGLSDWLPWSMRR
jgi:hypothetical protein